jgi:hypothetical protein
VNRSLIGIAVAVVLVPSSASAVVMPSHHRAPARAAGVSMRDMGARWLATERQAMTAAGATVLGGPEAPAAPGAPGVGAISGQHALSTGMLVAAGDLAGKPGHDDVLDVREAEPGGFYGVTARDGLTGKALWAKALTEPSNSDVSILPERLGATGKPAVLVIASSLVEGTTTATLSIAVEGLAGKTGKPLWSHTFTGTDTSGGGSTSVPTFQNVIHDVKGPATDILVTLETTLSGGTDDQTTPAIVSGVTGKTHRPGSAFASTNGFPTFMAIPDLTGDGLDDLLVLDPSTPGLVEAEHGHSGAMAWKQSMPVDFFTGARAIGSYSHRKITDIAIIESNPAIDDAQITVLSGSNGHALWSREASDVYLLQEAGKKLEPALGLDTQEFTATTATTTSTIAYEAVSVADKVIYSKKVSARVTNPPGAGSSGNGGGLEPLGDVQPDGSLDQTLSAEADSGSARTFVNGVVDGRTGKFRSVSFDVGADGSLRKGPATDLLQVEIPGGAAQVIGRRGLTGKRYYARMVPGLHHLDGADVSGLRVTGHSCSDIALRAIGGTTNTLAMLTARGAVLWSVRFTSAEPIGGTLISHKAPKQFCV